MLPIYSANQLKSWDQFSIQREGINSIDLMERAAQQFVSWFITKYKKSSPILIFCGNGNNGGDGLAIARLLFLRSYKVKLVLINVTEINSKDYHINLCKQELKNIEILDSKSKVVQLFEQNANFIVIDAILGYGLNREVGIELLEWFQLINDAGLEVISLDVPSGMYLDKMTNSICIHAKATFTFQNPKRCHLIPDTGRLCGDLHISDIDLDKDFVLQHPSELNFLELIDIKLLYKPRSPFSWKNKYGHVLLMGGSKGMAGAILLSASASLRSGCGLCSIRSIEANREIIQMTLPEAIYVTDERIAYSKYSCLVIGPGIGIETETKEAIKCILSSFDKPIVFDADALNCIASEKWIGLLHSNCLLTPHVGEFDRLFGVCSNGFERLDKAVEICAQYGIHIILKGKYTAIVCPDKKVYFNSTGNPGLAKGGSGDVLSGMLGSFLAQGYSILQASMMAVFMHGLAADITKEYIVEESIFPSDIIQNITNAFLRIKS